MRIFCLLYLDLPSLAEIINIIADLKATFQLQILGVKKNPQSPMYTQLGVMTKGTVIEVNVSELGMVTAGGKVVFGKYAQITNNPENDGCINAVLREFRPYSVCGAICLCLDSSGLIHTSCRFLRRRLDLRPRFLRIHPHAGMVVGLWHRRPLPDAYY